MEPFFGISWEAQGKKRRKKRKEKKKEKKNPTLLVWKCQRAQETRRNGPKRQCSTCIATCNQPVLLNEKPKRIYHFHHHFSKQPLQLAFTVWIFPWRPQPHHYGSSQGERSPEGSLQPTLPRALGELPNELSAFLISLEIKGGCGRLKNMLVLYQYFKRLK